MRFFPTPTYSPSDDLFEYPPVATPDGPSTAFVYRLSTPTHQGWNLDSLSVTPNETPIDRSCSGTPVKTNENSVAMNWTTVSGSSVKYQREVTFPSGTVSYFYNTPNYTPFSSFGSVSGIEGLWNTIVRAYEDTNGNNLIDAGENTSLWSNNCSIRFDVTAPTAPTITAPVVDYLNTTPILNAWTSVTDDSGIKEYRIEYKYDDDHTFSNFPYRTSTTNSRNHVPTLSEQGGVQFRVQAIDNAGNYGLWSDWKHYFYDATRPTVDLVFTGIGLTANSFKAIFSEDVSETEAENPANYFLNNWIHNGGADGDLVGNATIVYDSPSHTATVTFTAGGWYVSPEQNWDVRNVRDLAGNLMQVTPYDEDSTPMIAPVTTDSGTDTNWHNTDVTVTLNCNDGTLLVDASGCFKTYYSVDGGAYVEGTSIVISEDGIHTITYYSEDNAGNVESVKTATNTVKIDKALPAKPTGLKRLNVARTTDYACGSIVPLQTMIPDWDSISGDPSFSHYEYTSFNHDGAIGINEQVLTASEFVHTWVPTVEGTYGYAVRSVDFAGNKSAWALSGKTLAGSCQVTYDSTAPDVEITSPITSVVSGTVEIRGTVTDANPHHYWLVIENSGGTKVAGPGTVNDSTWFTNKLFFNWDTNAVDDGVYTIKLEARDAANNKDAGSVDWNIVYVDNTPPIMTLPADFTEEATGPSGADVSFVTTATDAHDGSIPVVCSPVSGSTFPLGTTNVDCSASDLEGNTATGSFTITVVDITNPSMPSTIGFSNPVLACGAITNVSPITVDWADSTDAVGVVGYDYYIEYPTLAGGRGTWNTTTVASQRTGTLNPGLHQLQVRARDAAGNVSDWTPFCDITYDITAPVISVPTLEPSEATGPSGAVVNFDVTATDNVTEELVVTCIPTSGSLFAIGDTTVNCTATDEAGNLGTGTFTVTVQDTTAPSLTDVPDATVYEGDAMPTVTVTGEDIVGIKSICFTLDSSNDTMDLLTKQCDVFDPTVASKIIDVNSWFSLPATVDLSVIPEGTYYFRYWFEDTAENQSVVQETLYTVVNVVPSVTISPVQNGNGSYTFTANVTDGNAPFTYLWSNDCSGTGVSSTTGTAPGQYDCSVLVTDADGDTDSASISRTIATVAAAAVLGEATEEAPEETPTPTPTPTATGEVEGERTCDTKTLLVGFTYVDKNANGTYDTNEQLLPGLTGKVVYSIDGSVYTVGSFKTDSNGKFSFEVCPGEYELQLDKASLSEGYSLVSDSVKVDVLGDKAETATYFAIKEEAKKGFSWWWVLLIVLLLGAGGYGIVLRRKNLESAA